VRGKQLIATFQNKEVRMRDIPQNNKLVDIWPELVHKIIIDSLSSQNPSFRP
jgi:hypothetical protein